MQRLALSFTASFLVLAGCSSDASLRVAPAPDADPETAGDGVPDGLPGFHGSGDDSPWANLDPGDIPDDLFAVAWVDMATGCINCVYGPNTPNRYDLVDALGQVVASFPLPFPLEDHWYYMPEMVGIHASGPGRFIVANVIQNQDWEPEQIVWEADAFAGTSTVLARLRPGEVELPLANVTLPVPLDTWTMDEVVLPDPTDPGRLLIVPTTSSPYLPSELSAIWSVSTTDPDALVRTWSIHELMPDELVPDGWQSLFSPWFADLADDGSGRLMLGITGVETLSDPNEKTVEHVSRPVLVGVDLDVPGEHWVVDAGGLFLNDDLQVVPPAADRPGTLLWTEDWCGETVTLWEDGATAELALPDEAECPHVVGLLDAPSRTFAYVHTVYDEMNYGRQRLVISAGGEPVHSLDGFGVGLSERPFHILGLAHVARE